VLIREHIPLKEFTTMRVGGPARFFSAVRNDNDLVRAVSFAKQKHVPIFILGSGSNIVVSDEGIDALVLKMENRGITFRDSRDGRVHAHVSAGENWDSFVEEVISRRLYGIENLSLIPGTAGATPIQNIGAYGQEISSTIVEVHAFDQEKMRFVILGKDECCFRYRESIFKTEEGKQFIVARIVLQLLEKGELVTEYKDVRDYFNHKNDITPSLETMRQAVIEIRTRKLPDVGKYGTVGSFFKNPLISKDHYVALVERYPNIPGYESGGAVKVPLAWIIEHVCGLKGVTKGGVGVYEKHSLVLVNVGNGTAKDVRTFAEEIRERVKTKTEILPEYEISFVGEF